MRSIRNLLTVTFLTGGAALTAAAGMSLASAADEATAAAQAPAAPGSFEGHRHGGAWQALGKLGLSAAQKQQIKDIMMAARPQIHALHQQMQANSLKLRQTKPTDPNYANVVAQVSQSHGTLSAQMMTHRADVRAQVFKILTPAQQTQLATLEARMPAHKHGGGPRGPDGGAVPAGEE